MTPDIIQVQPQADYILEAVFANGEKRRFDLKPYLHYPAFQPLTEKSTFYESACCLWNSGLDG